MDSNPHSDPSDFSALSKSAESYTKASPNRKRPRKRRETVGRKKARHRILSEWRGGIDPPSPKRNIHEPDEYLEELLKLVGLSDGVDEQRLKEGWSTVAGEFVSKHTVPDSIKGGILVLRVVNPMMKFHLQQMSGKLLKNLDAELGKGVVKQVVFKVG